MVRAYCHKIVSLAVLELYVGDVGLESEPDSEPLWVLLGV